MAKQPQNNIGNKLAERACKKGPSPDQGIPNAMVPSVRPNRRIGVFPDAKGPLDREHKNAYKGTSTWQIPKSAGTQQENDLTDVK